VQLTYAPALLKLSRTCPAVIQNGREGTSRFKQFAAIPRGEEDEYHAGREIDHNLKQSGHKMKTTRATTILHVLILFVLLIAVSLTAYAQEKPRSYAGDFLTRSTMTGDWGGVRNQLAEKGITFDFSLTQTQMGVLSGGLRSNSEYGGRGDFILNINTGQAGLWKGGFLLVEGEVNYGNGGNLNTGALLPVNLNNLFPSPGHAGRAAMPYVLYTQFLTHHLAVSGGKLTLTGSDANEFAHGEGVHAKGDTQFMNIAYNFSPLTITPAEYTPIGVGLVFLPGVHPNPDNLVVQAFVFSATGDSTKPMFDKFSHDDLSWSVEGRVKTHFLGKTGHQTFGYLGSNKEFTSLNQELTLSGGPLFQQQVQGSWLVYYNFSQYLWEPEKGKGFGLFGRFGASDGNPNLQHYFYELGVGGKGVGKKRPNDAYGLGTYYINISHLTLTTAAGTKVFLRDEKNMEAWYDFALTPWMHLTPDLQVVHGAAQKNYIAHLEQGAPLKNIDTAVVFAMRLRLIF
jgi:porin